MLSDLKNELIDAAKIPLGAYRRRPAKTVAMPVAVSLCSALIAGWSGALGSPELNNPLFLQGLWFSGLGGAALWHATLFVGRRVGPLPRFTRKPLRDILPIALLNLAFTSGGAIALYGVWLRMTGLKYDGAAAESLVLMAACLSATAAHIYRYPFESPIRKRTAQRVEMFRPATLRAQMAALKAQLDPHFLLNCVNGLCHLIDHDPASAQGFADDLAWIYQYVLDKGHKDLVTVREELEFVERYFNLMRQRFGTMVELRVSGADGTARDTMILPLALQMLVENAIKHNELSRRCPLTVEIAIVPGRVRVSNPIRPRLNGGNAGGLGLANLENRILLLTGRHIYVDRGPEDFVVTFPLVGSV